MEWSTRGLVRRRSVAFPSMALGNKPCGFSRRRAGYILLWTRKDRVMLARFSKTVVDFLAREDGPTAVEYAVMLALIIVVCIAAITALGTNANATFTSVSNTIGSAS